MKDEQKKIFVHTLKCLEHKSINKYIFIDNLGGNGKSYLLNVLIDYLKFHNINCVCVAWTGIEVNLFRDERTVHTTFKFPLNIDNCTTCNIKPISIEGKKFKEMQIIIWDEI